MKVAILCGGRATRLGPLTSTLPKSLIEVAGQPFIFHQLRLLHEQGFNEVVLCVGNFGGMIRDAVGDGKEMGMRIDYSWDGAMPLGTGGAVKKALPKLGDTFMVMYGDSYLPVDYRAISAAFSDSGKAGLMTRFKGVDFGIGILTPRAFFGFPDNPFDLGRVYFCLNAEDQLVLYEMDECFHEIGSLEGLEEVRRILSVAMNSTA